MVVGFFHIWHRHNFSSAADIVYKHAQVLVDIPFITLHTEFGKFIVSLIGDFPFVVQNATV